MSCRKDTSGQGKLTAGESQRSRKQGMAGSRKLCAKPSTKHICSTSLHPPAIPSRCKCPNRIIKRLTVVCHCQTSWAPVAHDGINYTLGQTWTRPHDIWASCCQDNMTIAACVQKLLQLRSWKCNLAGWKCLAPMPSIPQQSNLSPSIRAVATGEYEQSRVGECDKPRAFMPAQWQGSGGHSWSLQPPQPKDGGNNALVKQA